MIVAAREIVVFVYSAPAGRPKSETKSKKPRKKKSLRRLLVT
jgi:hypothetical protein